MSKIKEAKGCLVELAQEGHFNVIAHPCNCQNIMAVGIANKIKERFPVAELVDYRYWKENKNCKNDMLGKFSNTPLIESEHNLFIVANLYVQLTPGPAFQTRYFKWALEGLLNLYGDVRYAIPKIGKEIGANWNEVRELIYHVGDGHDITILHYD